MILRAGWWHLRREIAGYGLGGAGYGINAGRGCFLLCCIGCGRCGCGRDARDSGRALTGFNIELRKCVF